MLRFKRLVFGLALCAVALAQCGGSSAPAESDAPQTMTAPDGADWPMYRRDLAGTGYSPLTQITTDNAANLTEAWTYSVAAEASDGGSGPRSQVTPIVVDGVMYLPAADRVVALDPDTGSEIWRHEVVDGRYARIPPHGTPRPEGLNPEDHEHPEDNWVWNSQGAVNMHLPSRWGELVFE